MSSQGTNALPEKCEEWKSSTENNKYPEYYSSWLPKFEQTAVGKCLTELRQKAVAEATKTIKENDLQVAGLSGTGGLVCGLGLFPCICKLIAKLRG